MRGLPKSIIKKYGISKKAWRIYRSGKAPTKRRRSIKRGSSKMVKRKRRSYIPRARRAIRRRGGARGILSGLFPGGLVQTVAGAGGLVVMQRYQPFGGAYKPAIDKIALGVVMPMVGMGNKDMLSVGIKEGIATLVNQYLGGAAISPTGQGAL